MKIQGKRIMKNKPNHKNKILIFLLSFIAFLGLSIIIVPPMINLNSIKGKIENIILTKTSIPATIKGNVNFSLMGAATIVAHNIVIPNGVVSSAEFSIPFFDIFHIKKADISGAITVNGVSVSVEKIVPFYIKNKVVINNSKLKFLNKDYNIIHAELSDKTANILVRTDQHKYEIKSIENNFVVKNKNNNLKLSGELFQDGTAHAHIDIVAQNINKWFEFEKPKITGNFPITADILWDGEYGVTFYNIKADGVTGSVEFQNDGRKIINLKSDSADFDMSFFVKNSDILKNIAFNLDFTGKLKFVDKTFNHMEIITTGLGDKVKIKSVTADNIKIIGGMIDANGAHDLNISLPQNGVNLQCLFNGTPKKWACTTFSYGNSISGTINVNDGKFDVDFYSTETFADIKDIFKAVKRLGTTGTVKFNFPDMSGTLEINKDKYDVDYNHIDNKSLNWLDTDLNFIPEFMRNEKGNFVWVDDLMIFEPSSGQWQLSMSKDYFIIRGNNFKDAIQNIDLQSLSEFPYTLSGNYKNNSISNLKLEIADHVFTGTASNKSITLKTDVFDIDSFMDPYFIDNFDELSFFANAPIVLPFELGINIALSADKMIYRNQTFNNFVYSLNGNTQTFSISDSDRGNLLATLTKDNIKYALDIQLNQFVMKRKIFQRKMPLNISDTTVTAEIKLKTYGKIAHDIINNLSGTFDISLIGGYIEGFGFSNFYASAPSITMLNAENALDSALTSGITPIKKIHIVGTYANGDINTSIPFTLTMPHVDAKGTMTIINNEMNAKLSLILRGTSAGPEPIELVIYPNNKRDFSLSQIMMNFDAEYMREFVQTHNQF